MIWFSLGHSKFVTALEPELAIIQAQNLAIKAGQDVDVDTVRNEETGEIFEVTPMKLERRFR